MKKWIIYGSAAVVSLVLVTTVVGVVYEMTGRNHAAREFPPLGKMVDIGGRRIQLDCRGIGSPTVIFESGLGIDGSLSWSPVHDEIAKTTRACAYSRAGIMWSDPSDRALTGKQIAEDLHATLANAGERPPFVMVGHSLGGPYIMTYTKYFGPDVAGGVFVDAAHPDQVGRFNTIGLLPPSQVLGSFRNRIGAALNWTGGVRAVAASFKKMPNQRDQDDQAIKAYASTSLGSMLKESDALEQILAEAGTLRQLGDRPVYVLTAMRPLPDEALAQLNLTREGDRQRLTIWKEMQDEEASWSSRSIHQLVSDAGHGIQFDRPDIVIGAVHSVVEDVRKNRRIALP